MITTFILSNSYAVTDNIRNEFSNLFSDDIEHLAGLFTLQEIGTIEKFIVVIDATTAPLRSDYSEIVNWLMDAGVVVKVLDTGTDGDDAPIFGHVKPHYIMH